MPQTHKIVRDAVLSLMSDGDTGFNARLAYALPFYGISDPAQSIAIDWTPSSTSLLYCTLQPTDFKVSKLTGRLMLQIAPNGSQSTSATMGIKWSGIVGTRLVFTLRYSYRDGDEEPIEDDAAIAIASAIEDAVIEVFQRRTINWDDFMAGSPGDSRCQIAYTRPPDCPEGYIFEPLSDGCQVTIPMSIGFAVDAER